MGLHPELHSPFLSGQALFVSLELKGFPLAFRFDLGELDRCRTPHDVGRSFLLSIESGDRALNVRTFVRNLLAVARPRALQAIRT